MLLIHEMNASAPHKATSMISANRIEMGMANHIGADTLMLSSDVRDLMNISTTGMTFSAKNCLER